MAELWFYTNEGKQMDGVSIKELKRLVGDGVLKPTDMVWKEGMPRWIRASSIKELFPDPASDLDRFFTGAGESANKDASGESHVSTGKSTASPSPAPAKPAQTREAEPEPEPRERKRRRSSSANDDNGRRSHADGGGTSSMGIIIALVLGGGVLLVALVVGVIILIFAFQPPANVPNNNQRDGLVKNDDVKIIPGQDPAPFTLTLQGRGQDSRMVNLRRGATYQISVRSQWQGGGRPDVDLFVFNRFGAMLGADTSIGPDSNLTLIPRDDGQHRIEVRNLDAFIRVQATVTIQVTKDAPGAKNDKPPEVKEPPLPAGVLEGANVTDTPKSIFRGRTQEMRFRVKGGHAAKITATVLEPTANPGITVSVVRANGVVVVNPTGPARSVTVNFNLPATEIVTVRINNVSQRSTRCSVSYNVSP